MYILLMQVFVTVSISAQLPVIQSFSPVAGTVGTPVMIRGLHFSSNNGNNSVYFGTAKATITAVTDSTIAVIVPVGSVYAPIQVRVDSLIVSSKLPFITTFGNGASLLNNSYGSPSLVSYAQLPAVGDFDNDGLIDLVSILTGNKIGIYKNTDSSGVYVYRAGQRYNCVTNPSAVITADFNSDGKLDIVVAGNGSISIFKNISTVGNPAFQDLGFFSFSSSVNIFSITAGDVDGDGKIDLAVGYDHSATCFSVARNVGSGDTIAFGNRTSYAYGTVPGGAGNVGDGAVIALADADGDGKADISAVSRFFPPFLVYRNTSVPGTVSFAAKVSITVSRNNTFANGFYDFKLADIDGDNKPEILYVSNDSMLLNIYSNTSSVGNISFGNRIRLATSGVANAIAVNDMNGDGKADVVVMSGKVDVFINKSVAANIAFKPVAAFTGGGYTTLSIADMDADGRPDILESGNFYSTIVPYKTYLLKNTMGLPAPVSLCLTDSAATITSDIDGNTYQWQVDTGNGFENLTNDTVYTGTNTATLQVQHLNSSWSGTQYRCLTDGQYSTVQFLKFVATFKGLRSSLWNNPENWSCGVLPDKYTDVFINTTNAILNYNTTVKSVSVSGNGDLLVRQPYVLTLTH